MTRFSRAKQAFEDFTGHQARQVTKVRLSDRDVTGWGMGPVVGIAYEATRDGKKSQYFHEFSKRARPDLVSRDDGKQLFITGGKYTVTERGIEDMPEMFVVNPHPRGAAAKKRKVAPMAAAKRNTKGRFVKAGARTRPKARARTRQVAIFKTNPGPKRRRRPAAARVSVAKRRYRRNPQGRNGLQLKGLGQLIMPAAGVGAGAVGAEIIMGYLPIPAAWKTGILRHVTKGAVGLAAGWGIAHFLKQKKLGFYVMAGAVVIATHDAIKEFIAAKIPSVDHAAFGQYVRPLRGQFGGMGYTSPASMVRLGQYTPAPSMGWGGAGFGGMSQAYDNPGGETDFAA